MDDLKNEIRDEMNNVRIDKKKLYDLLLKMVDKCGGEASVVAGPPGPQGPPGPAGPAGPAGECKCPAPKKTVKKSSVA
jgi:hypothetical protein